MLRMTKKMIEETVRNVDEKRTPEMENLVNAMSFSEDQ